MIPEVEKAKAVMEAAQKNLSEVTEAAYPSGTVVVCRLLGCTVELIVKGRRGSDWANPGQMVGINTKTRKPRTFTDADVVRVVHWPCGVVTPPVLDLGYDRTEFEQVAWIDRRGNVHTLLQDEVMEACHLLGIALEPSTISLAVDCLLHDLTMLTDIAKNAESFLSGFEDCEQQGHAVKTQLMLLRSFIEIYGVEGRKRDNPLNDIAVMANLLESGEWAEHIGRTTLGRRLETQITELVGRHTAARAELASVTAKRDQALQLLYESRNCRRAAPYDFTDLLQRMDQVLAGYQPGVAHG